MAISWFFSALQASNIDPDAYVANFYDPPRQEAAVKPRRPDDKGPLSWELPKPDDRDFQNRCHEAVKLCGGWL